MAVDLGKINKSLEILLNYERGDINLHDASQQLSFISGLSLGVSDEFLRRLNRENVVNLRRKNEY